jgi:hypothetical protein
MPSDKMLPSVVGAAGEVFIAGGAVSPGTAPPVDGGRMGVRGVMGATGMGLSPWSPSWVDPNGMPTPPLGDFDRVDGEEGAPLIDEVALLVPPQEAVEEAPPMPPPSNSAVDVELPPDIELPALVQLGGGLMPGSAIWVAPIGFPVGGTGEPGNMFSGEVRPIPDAELSDSLTCAKLGLQPTTTATSPTISACFICTLHPRTVPSR